MKITLPTKPLTAPPVTRAQACPGLAEPEYRPDTIRRGQLVKLKHGSTIGRAQYRGRCVGLFSIEAMGFNAEVAWHGDAINELGNRGTFPADELMPA